MIFDLELLWQQKLCSGRRVQPRCPVSLALFAGNCSRSCFLNSALIAWCLEIPLKSQDFQLSFAHLAPPQSTFWAHFLLFLAAIQKSLLQTRMIPLLHFSARGDLETFSLLEIQAFTMAFPCSGADVTDTLSRARSCPCFPARGVSDFSCSHLGSVGWGRQGLAQD